MTRVSFSTGFPLHTLTRLNTSWSCVDRLHNQQSFSLLLTAMLQLLSPSAMQTCPTLHVYLPSELTTSTNFLPNPPWFRICKLDFSITFSYALLNPYQNFYRQSIPLPDLFTSIPHIYLTSATILSLKRTSLHLRLI